MMIAKRFGDPGYDLEIMQQLAAKAQRDREERVTVGALVTYRGLYGDVKGKVTRRDGDWVTLRVTASTRYHMRGECIETKLMEVDPR